MQDFRHQCGKYLKLLETALFVGQALNWDNLAASAIFCHDITSINAPQPLSLTTCTWNLLIGESPGVEHVGCYGSSGGSLRSFATMSTDLNVIVDDNVGAFSYSWSGSTTSSPWILSTLSQWYRGTSWYTSSSTQTGTITFTFNGTSAAFIGNTPPSPSPQTATIQIDNGTSFKINYEDPNPPTYKQWFTTPTLSDGGHTVTISELYGTAVDYAIVKVGNHTSLSDQTVIVDDDSSLIQYSGQWSRNTNEFIPGSLPTGYPYGNVTHRTSNPGDTFTFQFSGTSVAIYGIFSWYNLGSSLTTAYILDGKTYFSSISVTTSSPSYLNKNGEMSNYLYFSLDSLSSATHTLVVNVTQVANQTFILDYITYKPSFDSLASMPALSANASRSASSASLRSSATLSGSSVSSAAGGGSVPTGAIVGGVLGALSFGILATITAIILILRRRKARERMYADQDAVLSDNANYPNHPQTAKPSQTQERLSPLRPAATGTISPFDLSGSKQSYAADVHAHAGSNSTAEPSNTSSALPSSTTDNPTGGGEHFLDPPSYDTVVDSISLQPRGP